MSEQHLSVRSRNVVQRVGAVTFGELARFSEDEILSAKCFGETSLREIKEALAQRGLRLGMSLNEITTNPNSHDRILSGEAIPHPVEPPKENACCGDCETTARKLHARTDLERKLAMSLAELDLSVRLINCLESEGIMTMRDLVIRSDDELLEVRNFSEKLLVQVKKHLADHGLHLGMRVG